jgi:hypothetical protein
MNEINNYFETLERSLKKISIILIDDFEEIKKGTPGPIIALIRKLLFSTSTIVMKNMLLRGIASHVSDRKLVVATFDLLRETIKHSPPITIDQFFSSGFASHKLTMVSKIAEYVANADRTTVRTPQKTTVVVPNDALSRLSLISSPPNGGDQTSVDEYSQQLLSTVMNSNSPIPNLNNSDWPITDFLKHHIISEKHNKPKTTLVTTHSVNGAASSHKKDTRQSLTPTKRSNSAPRIRQSSVSALKAQKASLLENNGTKDEVSDSNSKIEKNKKDLSLKTEDRAPSPPVESKVETNQGSRWCAIFGFFNYFV